MSDALALDVLFFASYRDLVGTPESTVHLSPGATVAQLVDHLRDRGDGFEQLPTHPAVAVNQVVVSHDHVLAPGDEVALLPPVAGG